MMDVFMLVPNDWRVFIRSTGSGSESAGLLDLDLDLSLQVSAYN